MDGFDALSVSARDIDNLCGPYVCNDWIDVELKELEFGLQVNCVFSIEDGVESNMSCNFADVGRVLSEAQLTVCCDSKVLHIIEQMDGGIVDNKLTEI